MSCSRRQCLTGLISIVAMVISACTATGSEGTSSTTQASSPDTTATGQPATTSTLINDSDSTTVVGIEDQSFTVNSEPTNEGTKAEGLLLNSRMVNSIFDDENPDTVTRWSYPDTLEWDPERNTDEFLAALPRMADLGLNAMTVNLQGGNPLPSPGQDNQPWVNTAFRRDGSLKPRYAERLDRLIRAADRHGVVVIVGLFYFGQDHRIEGEQAVLAAVDNVTDWLIESDFTNVLVEIANESNVHYDHDVLQPDRIHELIERVRSRSGPSLLVSTSFGGGFIPPETVVAASDFVLLHGNNQTPAEISEMVATVEAMEEFTQQPKPIVFNEDSTSLDNMHAAIEAGASWGYHDKGLNDYDQGFQAPPVNWQINTVEKQAFFDAVAKLTEMAHGRPPAVVIAQGGAEDPISLDGANTSGEVLVNLSGDETVASAHWYQDDPFLENEPIDIDRQPPFQLNPSDGSSDLDTVALNNGDHIVTVLVTQFDRTETWLSATFRVDNDKSG